MTNWITIIIFLVSVFIQWFIVWSILDRINCKLNRMTKQVDHTMKQVDKIAYIESYNNITERK